MSLTFKGILLSLGMLISGTINTIIIGWQDETESEGRDGKYDTFSHPLFQTLAMFVGETFCFFGFFIISSYAKYSSNKYELNFENKDKENLVESKYIQENQENNSSISPYSSTSVLWYRASERHRFPLFFYFLIPSFCDMIATTLLYLSLLYTSISVYQMLRGAVIFFTAFISFIFLKKKLDSQHLLGLVFMLVGMVIIGLSSLLYGSKQSSSNPLVGDLLVISSQLIFATQFVVEEKLLDHLRVPALLAVGFEGVWGVFLLSLSLVIMYLINLSQGFYEDDETREPVGDPVDALIQIKNSSSLQISMIVSILSTCFLNFFGISITKYLSATNRTTIDECRTIFVWSASIILGWETFSVLQLIGFFLLVIGTFTYNKILFSESFIINNFYFYFLNYFNFSQQPNDKDSESIVNNNDSNVLLLERPLNSNEQIIEESRPIMEDLFETVTVEPKKGRNIREQRVQYYESLQLREEMRQKFSSNSISQVPLIEYRPSLPNHLQQN